MSLRLELATSTESKARGLGGRTELADDYGMLFIFREPGMYSFWMKDMLVPIDIYWLDDQGRVLAVDERVSPESYPDVFNPPAPVRYVLETRSGFAATHSIVVGSRLELPNAVNISE